MSDAALAKRLFDAQRNRTTIEPLTSEIPDLDLDRAYAIQDALVALMVEAGETVIGAKLGLVSRAKQEAMGVPAPLYAWLTHTMQLPMDEPLRLSEYLHPRAEPEIAFLLAEDIEGPGVNAHDVMQATAGVCAAIEVIDSRYTDFKFKLPDVVADNASSAAYVLSPRVEAADFDLALEGCLFEADGKVFGTAAGAAVMGHPAEAIAWLANELGERDRKLEAGWTILSGGLTAPAPLRANGAVTATFARLGSINLRAEE